MGRGPRLLNIWTDHKDEAELCIVSEKGRLPREKRKMSTVFCVCHNSTPNRTSPPPAEHCSLNLLREDLHGPQINCPSLVISHWSLPSWYFDHEYRSISVWIYLCMAIWFIPCLFPCTHNEYPPLTRLLATCTQGLSFYSSQGAFVESIQE